MKQEDKELLMKYLCMALPYGVILNVTLKDKYDEIVNRDIKMTDNNLTYITRDSHWRTYKPYLRPMSSMTKEERKEYKILTDCSDYTYFNTSYKVIEWLLKNHFDFMGLISKDLAIEVTESNNPYESNM